MRETHSFNYTMEFMSCDLLQFIAMYQKKEFHSCYGMKLYLLLDYELLIQKVIKNIYHYNTIGHSMRWYVICCDNNFCKRVVCKC